jgi:threonine dehydrogenase-like Zn-dependent dehydrogenase
MYDRVKQAVMLVSDRVHVLREMIYVCRPPACFRCRRLWAGIADKLPIGALMNKGLTVRTGQTHVNRFIHDLLRFIDEGRIDPSS